MKKLAFLFIFLPVVAFTQKVVILSVHQPPEFGFSVTKHDTTIVTGGSVVLGTDFVIFGGSGDYSYSWSPAATLNDSTSIHPVATPSDTTTYILMVTDNMGCSFSLDYTVNVRNPMVTNESLIVPGTLNAILFPNPNDGNFKVKLTGAPVERIDLKILDNTGKVLTKQTIRNFTGEYTEVFQVQLVSGSYTLHIDAGSETLSRQFIIH